MESTSIRFAGAARDLARAARLRGLECPRFKSPPRVQGYNRTIRRKANGTTIAITLRGRPWAAVLADMVEGVIVANGLAGHRADQIRNAMWLALDTSSLDAAA